MSFGGILRNGCTVGTIAWLAFAGVGGAALFAQEWSGPAAIEVRVEDPKGRAVDAAEIVLRFLGVAEAGGPAPLASDAKGRSAVGGLAPGRWALEVAKSGFMTYRAEIVVAVGEKPAILDAAQQNVPGARSTLRVRLSRLKSAPPARPAVVAVAAPSAPLSPPIAAVPAAPAASSSRPRDEKASVREKAPLPSIALAVTSAPPAEPKPEMSAIRETAPAPISAPPREVPAVVEAPPSPSPPVSAPAPAPPPLAPPPLPLPPVPQAVAAAPAPVAPPPPATVAPPTAPIAVAPPAMPTRGVAAPIARSCFECRPGESALVVDATISDLSGVACAPELAARLGVLLATELEALVASVGGGCAILRIDLPAGARYTGFRYEAAEPSASGADCLPGRDCPAGECRFVGEPIVRRAGDATTVFALFSSSAARRGALTVYWSRRK